MAVDLFANAANTTLSVAIGTAGSTSFTVTSGVKFPTVSAALGTQFRVIIDSELFIVTDSTTATWTVTPAAEGTIAATHLINAPVTAIVTGAALATKVTSAQAAAAAPVQTVAGRTGAVALTTADVSGLNLASPRSISANTTAVAGDYLLVNAGAAPVTVTLSASPTLGQQVAVKKIDASFNTVTVSGGTIDGDSSLTLNFPLTAASIIYNGSVWNVFAVNGTYSGGTPMGPPPGTPTAVSASAGNGQALVFFTPGTPAGTTYTATSSPGSFTATGAASPITVTGLTNGTAYTFTVTATATTGTSAPSAASNSITPVTAIATDTFVRANSTTTMGTTETGSKVWVYLSAAVWGIISNSAYKVSGAGDGFAVIDAAVANYTLKTTLATINTAAAGAGGYEGVVFRCVDASNYWQVQEHNGTYQLVKTITGTATITATYGAAAAGDQIQVLQSGSNITVSINNVAQTVVTDTALATATQVGLKVYAPTTGSTFTNFSVS